jgi:hypothetical protein
VILRGLSGSPPDFFDIYLPALAPTPVMSYFEPSGLCAALCRWRLHGRRMHLKQHACAADDPEGWRGFVGGLLQGAYPLGFAAVSLVTS